MEERQTSSSLLPVSRFQVVLNDDDDDDDGGDDGDDDETNLSVSPAGLPVPGGSQPLWSPAALLADAQFAQPWTLVSTFGRLEC